MAKARVVNLQFNNETIDFSQYTNHLLAEGDSWFAWAHLNLMPSSNVPEQLEFVDPTVIVNLAYSGDVVSHMADKSSDMTFYFELQGQRYHAILLSGGGNDLIDALRPDDGKPAIIVPRGKKSAKSAGSYVDTAALKVLMDEVLASYRNIIAMRDASASNANTPIVMHTYDYPTARNAKATFMGLPAAGPWLLPAMKAAKVPVKFYNAVTDIVFDALADTQLKLHKPNNNVHVVNTRNTLTRAKPRKKALSGDWINEIHPDAYGYSLIGRKLSTALAGIGVL